MREVGVGLGHVSSARKWSNLHVCSPSRSIWARSAGAAACRWRITPRERSVAVRSPHSSPAWCMRSTCNTREKMHNLRMQAMRAYAAPSSPGA